MQLINNNLPLKVNSFSSKFSFKEPQNVVTNTDEFSSSPINFSGQNKIPIIVKNYRRKQLLQKRFKKFLFILSILTMPYIAVDYLSHKAHEKTHQQSSSGLKPAQKMLIQKAIQRFQKENNFKPPEKSWAEKTSTKLMKFTVLMGMLGIGGHGLGHLLQLIQAGYILGMSRTKFNGDKEMTLFTKEVKGIHQKLPLPALKWTETSDGILTIEKLSQKPEITELYDWFRAEAKRKNLTLTEEKSKLTISPAGKTLKVLTPTPSKAKKEAVPL